MIKWFKRSSDGTGAPETIGPYRITDVLGRGGMGVVYSATDERLGRKIALKTLGELKSKELRDRLWREARTAASLNHPGICQVYGVEEREDELWIAMELLEGEGLDARLGRERLDIEEAVSICLDVLEPLSFLHGRGLVHRDLKPSNIFLTEVGIKLLDFGLARPTVVSEDTQLTQTGAILGTPHFMAPEQWRAEEVGARSDLFSCGAILYEMMSGRHAFPGSNAIDVFHACAHEQPPPLSGTLGIEAIDRVIRRAIAKKWEERPASAAEMAEELREAMERVRRLEGGAGRDTPLPQRRVETVKRFVALPFRMLRPDPEVDFLSTSLPEAIGSSLAGIRHLAVRSTRVATAVDLAELDLKKLASEVEVDYALAGNLMSAGSRLRLNAELLEVPSGTVVWSLQEDVEIGDLFKLQDDLASRVVEGVAIPLTSHEQARLHRDVPANPDAYEFYLRALYAEGTAKTTTEVLALRDLLQQSVDQDPGYVPARVQYARVCRVIGKYFFDEDPEAHLEMAREAFEKAWEMDPESPLLHNLYTYYQLEELGDARGAMLRLLERIREQPTEANLWAGLVPACRFQGLYAASVAAHERARALDPKIQTSVEHTYMQLGEFDQALAVAPERDAVYLRAAVKARQGDDAGAIDLLENVLDVDFEGSREYYVMAPLDALQGRGAEAEAKLRRVRDMGVRDPEAIFFLARTAARAGAVELGLEFVEAMTEREFYAPEGLERDQWFDVLRREPRFRTALERAREGQREAAAAFWEAGGAEVLGVAELFPDDTRTVTPREGTESDGEAGNAT
jgi:serine/threonine protein kinase/Tfp pilus assembly protein PilF